MTVSCDHGNYPLDIIKGWIAEGQSAYEGLCSMQFVI